MNGWRLVPAGLVLGLALVLVGGCGDDAPSEHKAAGSVNGKTPVVRPEDVNAKGAKGSAVLAPDYRRGLNAELAREEASQASPRRSPRSPETVPAPSAEAATAKTCPVPVPASAAPASSAPVAAASTGFPVADCRQLVLVVAPDFSASRATLRRFSRRDAKDGWRENGSPAACLLGRRGLGVGRGLTPPMPGPRKREGDRRTPAGLFSLPEAFGYASAQAAAKAGVRMPYRMVTDRSACLTDPASPHFGHVVGPGERSDGRRQERMKRDDDANIWGLVIGHNQKDPEPQAGSCVFINMRPAGGPPTGGSIGLPEAGVLALERWLDPAAKPLLAVLPEKAYQRVRQAWGLP